MQGGEEEGFHPLHDLHGWDPGQEFFVYKSRDRGHTWARYEWLGSGDIRITAMAVDPADPSIVFLGTNEYFAEGGLERSTDGGATWRMVEDVPAPITRLAIGDSIVHVGTSGHAVFNGSDQAGLDRSLSFVWPLPPSTSLPSPN